MRTFYDTLDDVRQFGHVALTPGGVFKHTLCLYYNQSDTKQHNYKRHEVETEEHTDTVHKKAY